MKKHFKQKCEIPDKDVDYNLGNYFEESSTGLHHMDFWDNPNLYDEMDLYPSCYEALKLIKEDGHDLVFISHTRPGHFSSKFRLLKRMPFLFFDRGCDDGFIATKEKGVLSNALDIMIDDRNKFLNQFYGVETVLYKTKYKQDEKPRDIYDLETSDWKEIIKFIIKIDKEN